MSCDLPKISVSTDGSSKMSSKRSSPTARAEMRSVARSAKQVSLAPVMPYRRNPASLAQRPVRWGGVPVKYSMYKRDNTLITDAVCYRTQEKPHLPPPKLVRWLYYSPADNAWKAHSLHTIAEIECEKRRHRKGSFVTLRTGDEAFVDFQSMMQVPRIARDTPESNASWEMVEVRREEVEVPEWEIQRNGVWEKVGERTAMLLEHEYLGGGDGVVEWHEGGTPIAADVFIMEDEWGNPLRRQPIQPKPVQPVESILPPLNSDTVQWEAVRRLKRCFELVTAAESRIRTIIHLEVEAMWSAQLDALDKGLEAVRRQQHRDQRKALRERRQREREERERQWAADMAKQHRQEQADLADTETTKRYSQLRRTVVAFEGIFRNLHETVAEEEAASLAKQARSHLRKVRDEIQAREAAVIERDRPVLVMQLEERQRRAEIINDDDHYRLVILHDLREAVKAQQARERAQRKLEEDRLKAELDKQAQERWQLDTAALRERRGIEDAQSNGRRDLMIAFDRGLEQVRRVLAEEAKRQLARLREAQQRVQDAFKADETDARGCVASEESEARHTLQAAMHNSWEIVQRPLTISPISSPKWVLGQTKHPPVALAPTASIRRKPKKWAPLGEAPITAATLCVHMVPSLSWFEADNKSDTLGLITHPASEGVGAPGSLPMTQKRLYRPSNPVVQIGEVVPSQSALSAQGLHSDLISVSVDFVPPDGEDAVSLADLEAVLHAVTFHSTSTRHVEKTQPFKITLLLQFSTSPDTVVVDADIKMRMVPPAITLQPQFGTQQYHIIDASATKRPHLHFLRHVTMPGVHAPEALQPKFEGGQLTISSSDFTPDDTVSFDETVRYDKSTGTIEVKATGDVGVLTMATGKGTRKGVRHPRRKGGEAYSAMAISFTSEWSSSAVFALCRAVRYSYHAQVPHRPKRMLEVCLVDSEQLRSTVEVEVHITFGESPVFFSAGESGMVGSGKAPFVIARGHSEVLPPDVPAVPQWVCGEAVVQSQRGVSNLPAQGTLRARIISAGPKDRLILRSAHPSLTVDPDGKLLWCAKPFGAYAPPLNPDCSPRGALTPRGSFLGGKLAESGGLRVTFSSKLTTFAMVQEVLRSVAFTSGETTGLGLGQRTVSVEMNLPEQAGEGGGHHRWHFGVRLLPPAVEPAVSAIGYHEGSGWQRVGGLDVPAVHGEDDVLNRFDGGSITVRLTTGADDEDSLSLLEGPTQPFEVLRRGGTSILYPRGTLLGGVPSAPPLGWYTAPAVCGREITVHLGAKDDTTVYTVTSDLIVEGGKQAPCIGPRQVKAVLSGIAYRCTSKNPPLLNKRIVVEVVDMLGVSSSAVVDIDIIPSNDPTEIHLSQTVVPYRQGTSSSLSGVAIFPNVELVDIDTECTSPGAWLTVELVGGDKDDRLMLEPVDERVVVEDLSVLVDGTVAVVAYRVREKSVGKGTTLCITFEEGVPLSTCAKVMQCIRYTCMACPLRAGTRTFQVRFNAGDGVADSRTTVEVNAQPPLMWTPPFARNVVYVEGSDPAIIFAKVISGFSTTSRIPPSTLRVEIIEGFDEDDDVLSFSDLMGYDVDQDGRISTRIAGSVGYVGKLALGTSWAEVVLDEAHQVTGKLLPSLVKCFVYHNTSNNPAVHLRTARATLTTGDGEDVIVEGTVEVQPVDDRTEIYPESTTAVYVVGQELPALPFERAEVEDPDTPVFQPPHSYITFELRPTPGGERPGPMEILSLSELCPVTIEGKEVLFEGVLVGRVREQTLHKTRIDLKDCPLDIVRAIVRGIAFRSAAHQRSKPVKFGVHLAVKGDRGDSPPTRVKVAMLVLQPIFEITPGFNDQKYAYTLLNATPGNPQPIGRQIRVAGYLSHFPGKVEVTCAFTGIRLPDGDPYNQYRLRDRRRSSHALRGRTGSQYGEGDLALANRLAEGLMHTQPIAPISPTSSVSAEEDAVLDFPDQATNTISLIPLSTAYRVEDDALYYHSEKVGTVVPIEDRRGHHGLCITLARPRLTPQHLSELLQTLHYNYEGELPQENVKVGVCLTVTVPPCDFTKDVDYITKQYACIRVRPSGVVRTRSVAFRDEQPSASPQPRPIPSLHFFTPDQ